MADMEVVSAKIDGRQVDAELLTKHDVDWHAERITKAYGECIQSVVAIGKMVAEALDELKRIAVDDNKAVQIGITVPKALKRRMDLYRVASGRNSVNWSAIAADAFVGFLESVENR